MGHTSDRRDSRDHQKCVGKGSGVRSIPRTRLETSIQDTLMSDKRNLSYADFHHEITRETDDVIPKYAVGSQQSQLLERPTSKEDELVRYMSSLPSYLEKGKDPQEKPLNVGVLDWKLLEKWRYTQKQTGQSHNGYSPSSSSSSSSLFSTDGSLTRSSVGQSRFPVQQRTHRLSLQAPLGAPPKDSVFSMNNPLYRQQQKVCGTLPLSKNNESELKLVSKHEVTTPWKGKTKIEGCDFTKQTLTKVEVVNREQREKSAYKVDGKLSLEIEKKFCSRSSFERSLPYKAVGNEQPEQTRTSSQYPENTKNSSHASQKSHYSSNSRMFDGPLRISGPPPMSSFPARMLSSPSRSRNTGENKPFAGVGNPSTSKPSVELDVRRSSCSVPRTRNPSPIRRLGSAMGKMMKNAGPRDNSPAVSCSIDTSCSNNGSNNRGRSSPLRRLLDPLLKSRGSNSPESSKKPLSVTTVGMNLFPGHSHCVSRSESLSLQALLQVSFKNGLPLFTFAIDNESDILAATVRKLFAPGKGHHYWTYTFFNVHEIKRKSGIWLNHGVGKGNGHGYVPNVVAQMRVTDSLHSFNKHEDSNSNDHFTREFDLFAVDIGHGDHFTTDFHPTNELAAIVAKLPRVSCEDPGKNSEFSYSWLETRSSDRSNDEIPSFGDFLHVSTTVILPGGVHTVPSRGEMSTLAQRWRSGGSCDCGGWDLGCQLQVYTNPREFDRKIGSSASTCSSENKFRLLSLVGQDKQAMLSLAPFKERIYSVEFNSSLSLLQAFAICISFLDCKRPEELSSEAIHISHNKINNELNVFELQTSTIKPSDHHQVGAPARYNVSYPPHSPFGRV